MAAMFKHLVTGALGLSAALAVNSAAAEAVPQAEAVPAQDSANSAATADAVKEAGEHYARGLALYGDGEFLLALVEFERAYQLSQNYKVLYNIGQVRIQLGRYAKAREALNEYLQQGGGSLGQERKQAVDKDLAMLVERTAALRIIANEPGAAILLDGKNMGTSPLNLPLVVDAGEHSLVLSKAGFYDQSRSVTLAGRDEIDVNVDLMPVAQAAGPKVIVEHNAAIKPSHTATWVGWATTGALAVTAGVSGYFGISKANDLQSMRTEYGVTTAQLNNAKSSARTLLIISDVTAGLAAVAGGVSLYFTLAKERPVEQRPASSPSTVALGIGPGSVSLRAAF
ncbi:MAG: PEGA domain-containing protein [Polyangiaceae bacterium]